MVEICRRLDGIPLAIELAASRMASMTASEVRDRLDQRFRLLVGSRRGLERHHTLRHAVAWSYDLLDDTEKALLHRCSVFAGGFDLQSACAVMGSDDDFAILDLLDALVRKSLLVADRSSGRTRFAMLETIRQFAEEQLVGQRCGDRGRDRACPLLRRARSRHPGPVGQPPPAGCLRLVQLSSWPICAPRFGGPPTRAISMSPPPSPPMRRTSACGSQTLEPIAWAEELIEPARAVDHPRLAFLYAMASQCCMPDGSRRLSATPTPARRLSAAAATRCHTASRACLALCTWPSVSPNGSVEWCRAQLARRPGHPCSHQGIPGCRTDDGRLR